MDTIQSATREIFWNISHHWVMYVLLVIALGVFAYGLYQRVSFWLKGKAEEERFGDWGKRFAVLVRELVFQHKLRQSRFPGLFHSFIFYSFVVLFITTAVIALDSDLGTNLFKGYVYVLLSLGSDVAGLLILVGLGMAAFRRYVLKPKTLETVGEDAWCLVLLALIMLTGFAIEGLRIAVAGDGRPWLSPVGWATSVFFSGVSEGSGRSLHAWLWWGHAALAMGWIAVIPYTKFFHFLALPTNIFFSKLVPRGELRHQDIDAMMESEDPDDIHIGIGGSGDFTWKQRLDFDACISCGRCEENCPAYLANQPFSPRLLIASLKDQVRVSGNGTAAAAAQEQAAAAESDDGIAADAVIGKAFDENFIWYCRTCTACMEVCPALIEHADTLIDIRRNEVLIQGRMPADAQRALKLLETHGNPFGSQAHREQWIKELGLRVIEPGEECDVIYWIGCCTTFDPTKHTIASSICTLLEKTGLSYGVLGTDEKCCGDPARVLGQDHLFQMMAREQIEAIKTRTFKVLLVSCPHCYNVLKHEYSQFGADFNVVHHSEFLHEALWSGLIKPEWGYAGRYVYHDPCYLGRYQKIYQAPREVIKAMPGVELLEMKSNKENSMCCGGGGGHYWMDLHGGERINTLRVKQAVEVGANHIVTGCAYCKQMLEDSVKLEDKEEEIRILDLATLVLESITGQRQVQQQAEDRKESGGGADEYVPSCGG